MSHRIPVRGSASSDSEEEDQHGLIASTSKSLSGHPASRRSMTRLLLLVLSLLLSAVTLWQLHDLRTQVGQQAAKASASSADVSVAASVAQRASATVVTERTPRLADGCSHVYLDLGTNIGIQLRKLFEPELYDFPNGPMHAIYDRFFGKFDETDHRRHVCAFGFEPNPVHIPYLDETEAAHRKHGFRTTILHVGALDRETTLPFDKSGVENFDGEHANWAGHLVTADTPANANAPTVDVPVIDFPAWFAHHVLEREFDRSRVVEATQRAPSIVMKLDIEGSDPAVVGAMLRRGYMCHVNFTYGEHLNGAQVSLVNGFFGMAGCTDSEYYNLDDESFHNVRLPFAE